MPELTKEYIQYKLKTDVRWLERAVLAIYRNQTVEEKVEEHSVVINGRGFNRPDSEKLTPVAKYLLKGYHLSAGYWLSMTRKRMQKYAGQLLKISKVKKQTVRYASPQLELELR